MSINWVMLSPNGTPPFTPLPSEQTLFTSSPRITFTLNTPAHFPGKQQIPFTLSASSGILYLTSRRIIFLPDKVSATLQSFAAPILSLHDSHVTAPWFGPNVWTALLQPTVGGGIPTPPTGVVEVKMTFKEGGAFDFHAKYEQVRERLQQALEVARMDGPASTAGSSGLGDMPGVHLDDLPAYQERGDGPLIPPIAAATLPAGNASRRGTASSASVGSGAGGDDGEDRRGRVAGRNNGVPDEPPPGYEEAQLTGLRDDLEHRRT